MYENVRSKVCVGSKYSSEFNIKVGVASKFCTEPLVVCKCHGGYIYGVSYWLFLGVVLC